jgi:cell wall-associated NlpC family hydrolase
MRRLLFVICAVFAAASVVSLSSLSASAQTGEQYEASGVEAPDDPQESTAPGEGSSGASSSDPAGADTTRAVAEQPDGTDVPESEEPAPAPVPLDPHHQVVDNPSDPAGSDAFTVNIPKTRYYSVYSWWNAGKNNAPAARFGVPTAAGMRWDVVDQRVDTGFWVRIGAFKMQKGERTIRLEDGEGGGEAVAEAVMVVGDAVAGPGGETASFTDPNALEPIPGSKDTSFSTQRIRNPSRGDVKRVARRHLGTPYGNNRCDAFKQEDCSCHTKLVYRKFDIRLPDSPVYQWRSNKGNSFKERSKLRTGDLVFHDLSGDGRLDDHFADHVSIYAGNGNIIHASNYYKYEKVVMTEMKYLNGFWGGKRFKLR